MAAGSVHRITLLGRSVTLDLRTVRLLTIILPVIVLLAFDILRHTLFQEALHSLPAFAALYAFIVVGAFVFSYSVFGLLARLQTQAAKQDQRLSVLHGVSMVAAEKPSLENLLSASLDRVLAAVKAEAGLICLVDLDRAEHTAVCYRGFSRDLTQTMQRAKLEDDPIATEVIRSHRAVRFGRLLKDPVVATAASREGFTYGISTPLMAEGEVNGILVVARRTAVPFKDDDQVFLGGLGAYLGLAVRNAVLYERSKRDNEELSAFLQVGKAAASAFDLDKVLVTSLEAILQVTPADAAELWLTDPSGDLVLRQHRGAGAEAFHERTRLHPGEGLVGVAAQGRDPLVTHELGTDPRFVRSAVAGQGFKTYCALPLRFRDQLVGVLGVAARAEDAFTARPDLRLLEGVGEQLAVAIENARLHQQLQDQAVVQERERIAREMHDGLAQMLGYIITQTLALKKLVADDQRDKALNGLTRMEDAARGLYTDVREGIVGLRTSPQASGGIIPAIRSYLERYQDAFGITSTLEVGPATEQLSGISPAAEIQLLRIVQEALTNARKHADPRRVQVRFGVSDGSLAVQVADDGRGFDMAQTRTRGWPRFGLQTMRERAESVGGTLSIETAPGAGTRVTVLIPMRASEP